MHTRSTYLVIDAAKIGKKSLFEIVFQRYVYVHMFVASKYVDLVLTPLKNTPMEINPGDQPKKNGTKML